MKLLNLIFGDKNKKLINSLGQTVSQINEFEEQFSVLTNEQLKEKTKFFEEELTKGKTLDEILPQAFASVREAAKRTINQRHYDVQLISGLALHQGHIAEQKTGEGKTLSATLSLYLNALSGLGCHLVTVNDYLSRRDCGWVGAVYCTFGLSCGGVFLH